LRDVADSTGGLFVPAATAQVELGEILTRSLGDIERTEGDSTVVKTAAPLFQWPAALALALLVIESLIAARARRLGQSGSGASRPIMDAGMPATPPAPQRRRRSRPRPAPAVAAALAAVAAISAATTEALARDRADALPLTLTPPAAGARDSGSSAGEAPEDSASRTGAAKGPRLRRTGRGQIDRAAFRDAVSRANASMQSGQYADAAAAFAEAVDADPTSAAAAYNRGVAEYRAGMLAESAASFAQAASLGDAKLAADAMFNQGNATYQGALRALPGAPRDAASAQPAALPPATNGTDGVPDLKAAAEAVSKALTHYKDSIAANPDDVDSRANAEIAHALLKRLEQMQQQQDDQEKDDSDEKDQQEQQDQSQDGQQCDNPKQGDGQEKAGQKKKGQSGGGSPSQSEPPEGEQPDDPTQEQKPEGERTDTRTDKPETSKEGSDSKKPDESDAGDDRYSPQDSAPDDDAPKQEKDSRSQDKKDQAGSKDELKARGDSGQDKSDQQPPAPAQARGGEPVPGAPLTKAEAERLLQGVRDRAKQRMEAKERADRVRQAPAVRDW
jgi:tetratricopeptide (TPR) repeat protein